MTRFLSLFDAFRKASCSHGESSEGRGKCTNCHENSLGGVHLALVVKSVSNVFQGVAELLVHVEVLVGRSADLHVLNAFQDQTALLDALRPSHLSSLASVDLFSVSFKGDFQFLAEPAALFNRAVVL